MAESFFQRRRFGQHARDGARRHRPEVSLIIPALNEANGLEMILPRVPGIVDELIVVDGGSTDDTVELVRQRAPHAILIVQTGRGKGNALKCGIAASRGDIIITMDADGSMNPEDIQRFVDDLHSGMDFVKGSRVLPGAGSADFTRLRRVGNASLTRFGNLVFGSRYTDLTYGFNAYWRPTIQHLGVLADGFEFEIQAALRAASVGMRTSEVPAFESARVGGESKLNPFTDGLAILRIIVSEASPRKGVRLAAHAASIASSPGYPVAGPVETHPEREAVPESAGIAG